ncbi:hypothetical protein B9Z19DRAFT_1069283 [Tuber borchii]|uniref:Uncharacterized protein n=1 Tax=Tuber borchii TaxID=42251 RepID=A0A2T6ZC30_TUBBO|nr:hypothetical protein B9Z19DRAFT_1069283 [Tuber borchii]
MAPFNRSAWHDTHIYGSDNRDKLLGGLWAGGGITNEALYFMTEVVCCITDTFTLHDKNDELIERDASGLEPGTYYITTNGKVTVTQDVAHCRAGSRPTGPRCGSFRKAVRMRDKRCIATLRPVILANMNWWSGFEAAHVIPLAFQAQWDIGNFGSHITIPPPNPAHGTINSVQNGILLTREMHYAFDNYSWSINPDDNHKIVCFTPDLSYYGIAGRNLDQTFLDNPSRPPDELFRWHFRQAVLRNMKPS